MTIGDVLQVGNKVRIFWNENNINNCPVHIRAIVDSDYVVTRRWLKRRQEWSYKVEHVSWYETLLEGNRIKKVTR